MLSDDNAIWLARQSLARIRNEELGIRNWCERCRMKRGRLPEGIKKHGVGVLRVFCVIKRYAKAVSGDYVKGRRRRKPCRRGK